MILFPSPSVMSICTIYGVKNRFEIMSNDIKNDLEWSLYSVRVWESGSGLIILSNSHIHGEGNGAADVLARYANYESSAER